MRILLYISVLLLICILIWMLGFCWYQPLSLIILLPLAVSWIFFKDKVKLYPWLWGVAGSAIFLYIIWPAPQPEAWQISWAKAPECRVEGDTLTIRNIRDFHYRAENDYDVVYRDERFDLTELQGADFAECHWDGMTAVCHTMLSFNFTDGRRLVVSAETRLPAGVKQSSVGGLYKLYGLLYIFGTEEDIFRLRTNHRHEDLSLYPLNITPQGAKKLLLHYVHLAQEAESGLSIYNTLTANCSTGLVSAFRELAPDMPKRYNLLPIHNGSFTQVLYKAGALQTYPGETETQLRKRCYLGYDIAPDNRAEYSAAIRRLLRRGHEDDAAASHSAAR